MIRFSKAGKVPCRSWSLQALDTCPASRDQYGELVPACKGCYAVGGNYRFKNVKSVREENRKDWRRVDWVQDMIDELDVDRYFRWFDSGDIYSIKLAEKILEVCTATPWVKHWIPTRMYKLGKFRPILERLNALPNVVVRYSSDGVNGETIDGAEFQSTIISNATKLNSSFKMCQAFQHGGKCLKCRACWSKENKIIAYMGHGASMIKEQSKLNKQYA